MKRECDDRQLKKWIRQIADGDTEALVLLYNALFRPLCFFILSVLKSDTFVEDVAQETFIRVYQNAEQFEEKSSVKTWIYSMAKNLCYNHLRDINRTTEIQISNGYDEDFTLVETAKSLECLEQEEQQIIILHVFGGFRIKEIAELLKIPEKQAYYRKETATEKLKRYYDWRSE